MAQELIPHRWPNNNISSKADLISEIDINLPESEFWNLVSVRLNLPLLSITEKYKDREFWTEEYLIDELFLQLAGTKMIVKKHDDSSDDKLVSVHKYYNQAFRLRHRIPVVKPAPEFIVNMSDLDIRILAELKALDNDDADADAEPSSQYILKQAVGRIFENIDAKKYHLSIARNLEVVLKP
jgi:hypothetical protein